MDNKNDRPQQYNPGRRAGSRVASRAAMIPMQDFNAFGYESVSVGDGRDREEEERA